MEKQKLIDCANEVLRNTPIWDIIRIEVTCLNSGKVEMKLEIEDKHLNPLGICHGGIISTFADTAMGVALRTLEDTGTTVEMNINYLIPVNKGQILVAKAEVLRKGNTTAVIRADIFAGNNIVAASRATFYIIKESNQEQEMN